MGEILANLMPSFDEDDRTRVGHNGVSMVRNANRLTLAGQVGCSRWREVHQFMGLLEADLLVWIVFAPVITVEVIGVANLVVLEVLALS